jgi:sulfur-oxidizing protein SoxX
MKYNSKRRVGLATATALLLGSFVLVPVVAGAGAVETGKKLSFDRKKGNCLACHAIKDGVSPGNIAPPLLAMKARYPDKNKLRAQIWDATTVNPESAMPPFGKHKILSSGEIDQIVEYIWTL